MVSSLRYRSFPYRMLSRLLGPGWSINLHLSSWNMNLLPDFRSSSGPLSFTITSQVGYNRQRTSQVPCASACLPCLKLIALYVTQELTCPFLSRWHRPSMSVCKQLQHRILPEEPSTNDQNLRWTCWLLPPWLLLLASHQERRSTVFILHSPCLLPILKLLLRLLKMLASVIFRRTSR